MILANQVCFAVRNDFTQGPNFVAGNDLTRCATGADQASESCDMLASVTVYSYGYGGCGYGPDVRHIATVVTDKRSATFKRNYMQAPVLLSSPTASASTHLRRKPFKAFVAFGSRKAPHTSPLRTHICSCTAKAPAVQISKAAKTQVPQVSRSRITSQGFLAGPTEEAPDYGALESSPWNKAIMALFRRKMVNALEEDSEAQG